MSHPPSPTTEIHSPTAPPDIVRIGGVSYLNAKPLLYGLDEQDDIELILDVPARLLNGLRAGRFDVALLPTIDYQRFDGLRLLHAGAIGSDGPALTVRIFSRPPIERITTLACDTESHTSVALARIILAERYRIRPEFIDLSPQNVPSDRTRHSPFLPGHAPEAILLIGDKVVREPPDGYPRQLDLGQAWKDLTGRPFVFAAWMARNDLPDIDRITALLNRALERGLANIPEIIHRHALPGGWPQPLAHQYLTRNLDYRLATPQLQAMRHFHTLAARHGLIPPPRPV